MTRFFACAAALFFLAAAAFPALCTASTGDVDSLVSISAPTPADEAPGAPLPAEDVIALLTSPQADEGFDEIPEHGAYERGFTTAELLRNLGIFAVVVAVVLILSVQFKKNVTRSTYRWLMLIGLFILPFIAVLSAMTTTLETTKTVDSCASCHVMDPFVDDMLNAESNTLAARHYQNKWIPTHQCYECHTTYGVHGTLEGKRDGFRHWLLYVTQTWEEPITYAGSYPNANCTACHAGTPAFEEVNSHRALAAELSTDATNCTTCHGPPHPLPQERYPEAPASPDETTAEANGAR